MRGRRHYTAGLALSAVLGLLLLTAVARADDARRSLVLSGGPLSVADIIEVARHGKPVEISPKARARVAATFQVVLAAARANLPVYGLTTGVGWNKDKEALKAAEALDPDLMCG
jgi:histidine ammonia-lyase